MGGRSAERVEIEQGESIFRVKSPCGSSAAPAGGEEKLTASREPQEFGAAGGHIRALGNIWEDRWSGSRSPCACVLEHSGPHHPQGPCSRHTLHTCIICHCVPFLFQMEERETLE